MRKLVTIRKIDNKQNIEGADFIELVMIDGWQCVAKKGEFQVGDKCVYFEIDSLLPISDERFSFLSNKSIKVIDNIHYHRLRTMKLRGELSQGLALPITSFPELINNDSLLDDEYIDYSETLNITKYEPPIRISGNMKIAGNFPTHLVNKTDEERIQNLFNKYKHNEVFSKYEWSVSEKVDGTSFTCLIDDENIFRVCSRNFVVTDISETYKDHMLEEGSNVYTYIAKFYQMEERLRELKDKYGMWLAIQGEIIGPGIQGNSYKLQQPVLTIFNVFNITNKIKSTDLQYSVAILNSFNYDLDNIITKYNTMLSTVPILYIPESLLFKLHTNTIELNDLLNFAEGKSILNNNTEREGVVFVGKNRENSNDVISFKVISNKFLLKEKE